MSPQLLQSPIQWPVASIAGQKYQCKFSFGSALRIGRANIDARYPPVQINAEMDAAAIQAAQHTILMRNLLIAACTLGNETPEGNWVPINLDASNDAVLEALPDRMLPNEYNTLVSAINEANRLAQEAQAAAQSAPRTSEPSAAKPN